MSSGNEISTTQLHEGRTIVIIGGGPAGYEAALVGALYGADVTLIEDQALGGSAVLHDCVPSKTFISLVRPVPYNAPNAQDAHADNRRRESQQVPLDVMKTRISQLASAQSHDVRHAVLDAGVRVMSGRAEFTDVQPHLTHHSIVVTHKNGEKETLRSEIVLIATGASPRVLPNALPDGERIFNWREIYRVHEVPDHLVVVGSGVTGAEFVSAFAEMGVKVTMVASRDRILPYDDADAADVLEDVLARRGVELVKHARVDSVDNTGDGVVVRTTDGRKIRGSHALLTVGSVPNTSGMGLENVGVELTSSGHIHVDRVSRTNVQGIYAAGDCTDLFPLASVAAMQGRIAMYHALGEGVIPIRLKTVANAVFTRPEIAAVGVTQSQIERGEVSARAVFLPLATNPRAKMRSLEHGFVKLFCREHSGIIIGGVIVAPGASELILSIALAVNQSMNVADLAETFAVYPSLSGSITEAARQLVQPDDLK